MQRTLRNSLNPVPTLKADLSDRERISSLYSAQAPHQGLAYLLLWLLVMLQSIVLVGGGWWCWQQIEQSKRKLADSQHSLARINEQIAARIQRIDGKLISTESTVNSGSESLRQQISQLHTQLDTLQKDLKKQQDSQKTQDARQDALEKQLAQFGNTSKAQVESLEALNQQLAVQGGKISMQNERLAAQQSLQADTSNALKTLQQAHNEMQKRLKQVTEEVATVRGMREQLAGVSTLATKLSGLQKELQQADTAIKRLEREQLALKGRQENSSVAEFDAFRAQTTRSLNSLQTQVQRLQQQR